MSISNLSIDPNVSTEELATMASDYRASLEEASTDPNADDSYVEWLESGLEIIDDLLAHRLPVTEPGAGFGGQDITYERS